MISMLLWVWKCKTLLVMRLTFLICLFFALQSIAIETLSQNQRVSISQKNIRIEDVIQLIENKTDYYFMYSAKTVDVERTIDIEVANELVPEILSDIFRGTDITYKIDGRLIALTKDGEISSMTQQTKTVSGKVTDSSGIPIPGVTVIIKGKATGTITDAIGNYSLSNVIANGTLQFSFVGMKTQEILLGGKTTINVTLIEETVGIEEVVAVGYGVQKKTSITAAVGTIKTENIVNQPVANISNSIGGRVSGVIFTQNSGEPGKDAANILIRGIGTLGNQKPLTIVDGIPRDYAQLDPNSIATISVLKDAAAVAPYGVGGANGVILITTKKGETGKPQLSYNGYVGWQNPTVLTKFVNSYQYATLFNAANDNAGKPHAYSNWALQKYKDHSKPDMYPDNNVLKELITPNTLITSHNLEMSGGAEKIKYYAGLGYFSQEGMWGPANSKRYNIISNIESDPTKTTKVSLSVNGTLEEQNSPGVNVGGTGIFYQAFRTPPTQVVTFSNGLPGGYISRSVYGYIFNSGYQKNANNSLFSQISIEQQLPFIKGLSVKGAMSFDFSPRLFKQWLTPILYYSYDSITNTYPQAGNAGPAKPNYTVTYSHNKSLTCQAYVNYHNVFGKHDITGLIVLENRNWKSEDLSARRLNYNVSVPELNNGSSISTDINNSGMSSVGKQKSAVYRFTYAFDNKYLLEASGRYDGNYYFAPGHRFGFFPAFALGWRLSEEEFVKNNFQWITNLKLRGSYGESGALAGSPFQYLNAYSLSGNAAVLNGQATQGLYEGVIPNPDITWERAKKTDIGIEAALWKNLLTIEADYFTERRSNMLFPSTETVPVEFGNSLSQVNSGSMSNHGFEVTLGTSHSLSNGITVGLTTNFTFARNKLLEVFETAATFNNPNRRKTGRPYGTTFGYRALGYFTADDFNPNGTLKDGIAKQTFNTSLYPGDLRYDDISGPEGKPDGRITPDDMVPIGKSVIPEIIYGFTPSISYKGFDLSLLFQGAANRDFEWRIFPFDNSSSATIDALDYWTTENPDATFPRITTQPTPNNTQSSSWWIRNGSYLRLKTGQLGYNLPKQVLNAFKIEAARFYISGQNLITWSKIENFDPEVSESRGLYYPQQKTVSVGLNVTF